MLCALPATACIYDANERCDAHQHDGPNKSCVCDDGFIFVANACVACGQHEVVNVSACVCDVGYARSGDETSPCVKSESGLGLACDPGGDASDCADSDNPVCRNHGGSKGGGYCTHACRSDSDCGNGFVCDTKGSPQVCKSQAPGEFMACTTDAECPADPMSALSATLCDTTFKSGCRVQGCKLDNPLSCSDASDCCNLAALGLPINVCFPGGMCP